jgi:hypothetical protein
MPYSATVVESEGNGAQLLLNLALFKKKDLIFQILNLGDNLLQDFIAVNGISEECILG